MQTAKDFVRVHYPRAECCKQFKRGRIAGYSIKLRGPGRELDIEKHLTICLTSNKAWEQASTLISQLRSIPRVTSTVYYCHFVFGIKQEHCIVQPHNGIASVKDGFWINASRVYTTSDDCKYWIPASRIIFVEKVKL